jgi:pseudaminic acid synthase
MITVRDAGREVRLGGGEPFLIAEMSGNHNQSLERALAIVDAAATAGASALKIQTYTADTMTIDVRRGEFMVEDPGSLWAGRSLYDLYQEAHTPWEWHAPIFARCRERGIIPFSTPFDASAVAFLDRLGCPLWKIASFELTDLPLIRACAATGRPLIMSTGMATLAEIGEAVEAARQAGCRELVLLKCTSSYPAPPSAANLATIPHLAATFGCLAGLSDHTDGIGCAVAAVALGAAVIEKHFTLSRADGGVDSAFSLEPAEFAALAVECRRAAQAVGVVSFGPGPQERQSLRHRRSLYFVRDLAAGAHIAEGDVRCIRPGLGLAPRFLPAVMGRRVAREVRRGEAVSWEALG